MTNQMRDKQDGRMKRNITSELRRIILYTIVQIYNTTYTTYNTYQLHINTLHTLYTLHLFISTRDKVVIAVDQSMLIVGLWGDTEILPAKVGK